jgi:hypothetical protein
MNRMDINMVDDAESDLKKFTYHESARIIRTVLDRICEFTYTGDAPTHDECETLCDMLIELHQLSYGITLHTLRSDDPDAGGGYEDDELYADRSSAARGCRAIRLTIRSQPKRIAATSVRRFLPAG